MGGEQPESTFSSGDPIADMLLHGDAETASQAEQLYLDAHLQDVFELVRSRMSDAEFRSHPLIVLLMAHGSRGWEDSLT